MTTKRIYAQQNIELESEEVNITTNPATRLTANGYQVITEQDTGGATIITTTDTGGFPIITTNDADFGQGTITPFNYPELTSTPIVFPDGSFGDSLTVTGGVCTFLAGAYLMTISVQQTNTGNTYVGFNAPTFYSGGVSQAGPVPITGLADARSWNLPFVFPSDTVCTFSIHSKSVDGINPCVVPNASFQFIRLVSSTKLP